MRSAVLFMALFAWSTFPALAQSDGQGVAKPGSGISAPQVEKEVKPAYPGAALQAGVSGNVTLECVVNPDGSVGEVRVVQPVEPSLDQAAVDALKQWRFKPGTKDGQAVPVMVTVEMTFTHQPRGPKLDSPEVYRPGEDVTTPRVLKEIKPMYTPEAMRKGVQGALEIECVVLPDGTVGDTRIISALHPQLDAEALKALRQWRFEPGMKAGKAVPVRVAVTMTFTSK